MTWDNKVTSDVRNLGMINRLCARWDKEGKGRVEGEGKERERWVKGELENWRKVGDWGRSARK